MILDWDQHKFLVIFTYIYLNLLKLISCSLWLSLRPKTPCSPFWGIWDLTIILTSSAFPTRSKFGSRIAWFQSHLLLLETPRSSFSCWLPLEVRLYCPHGLSLTHCSCILILILTSKLHWCPTTVGTNIDGAIQTGSSLLRDYLSGAEANPNSVSLIIFLTDGRPTVGEIQSLAILGNTRSAVQEKFCIFTIGIGNDVDYRLLERMALENCGMMRRIREEADASAMLKG